MKITTPCATRVCLENRRSVWLTALWLLSRRLRIRMCLRRLVRARFGISVLAECVFADAVDRIHEYRDAFRDGPFT